MVNIVKGANLKKLSILVILLISVTCLTFAFMPASAVSHAETDGTYQPGTYRVKNNVSLDVYTRFLNGTEIKLFEIPSTYYFDVTEIDGDVFYIKYNGLDDLYVKDASNFVSLTDADKEPLGGFTIELSLSSDASFYVKGRSGFTMKTLTPAEAPAITFSCSCICNTLFPDEPMVRSYPGQEDGMPEISSAVLIYILSP